MGVVTLLLLSLLLPLVVSHDHHHDKLEEIDKKYKCGKHEVRLTSTSKQKFKIDKVGCWIHIWRNSEEDNYVMNDPRVRAITDRESEKMKDGRLCEISVDTNHIYYTTLNDEEKTIDAIIRVCEERFRVDWWMICLFSFSFCAAISLPCFVYYFSLQAYKITKDKKLRTTTVKHMKKLDTTIGSSGETLAHSNPKSAGSSNK